MIDPAPRHSFFASRRLSSPSSSLARSWLWVGLASCLAAPSTACSATCSTTGQSPVLYQAGTTNSAGTYYESGGWNDEYLDFPAGKVYDFVHGLRSSAYVIKAYLAFSARPLSPDALGNVAESAGNQVIYEAVGPEFFRVRNDTCAHFYLRVVAFEVDPDAPDAGVAGAAGSDGG